MAASALTGAPAFCFLSGLQAWGLEGQTACPTAHPPVVGPSGPRVSFGPGLAPGCRSVQQRDYLCPPKPWRCLLHKGKPRTFFSLGPRCVPHPFWGDSWLGHCYEWDSVPGGACREPKGRGPKGGKMNNRLGAGKNRQVLKSWVLFSENFRTDCISKVGSVEGLKKINLFKTKFCKCLSHPMVCVNGM